MIVDPIDEAVDEDKQQGDHWRGNHASKQNHGQKFLMLLRK
jgi:hypothetical protein